MSIPIGTTGRQLAAIARWMLAGVVIVGMLSWWWPEYRTWGATAACLLAVWMLWLIRGTVTAEPTVPGHPVYSALLGPAAVLTMHLTWSGLGMVERDKDLLAGGINMSMLFQLALLALGILLTQSLLPRAASHAVVLSVCGAAMVGGMGAAAAAGRAEQVRGALALVGFAGVCVWLCPLWADEGDGAAGGSARRHELRVLYVCPAVAAVAALSWFCPVQAVVAASVAAGVVVLAAVARCGRAATWATVAVLLAGAAAAAGLRNDIPFLNKALPSPPGGAAHGPGGPPGANGLQWVYGRGEEAFHDVSGADSGLVILLGAVGWGGASWLLLGMAVCLMWMMRDAKQASRRDRTRTTVWAVATALSTGALLSPGGMVLPAVTLAAAFTWGLLPTMTGRKPRPRPGTTLLVLMVALDMLLGIAQNAGLVAWATSAFYANDAFLHASVGFYLAMVIAWLMSRRTVWWGLVGIALAAVVGGAGEVLQGLLSRRRMQFADWGWHAVGSALAILPYLPSVASRLCESRDAREYKLDSYGGESV